MDKCTRSPSSRMDAAQHLRQALAVCTIKPQVVPGFAGVKPLPKRRAEVDPDTRLKRRDWLIRPLHAGGSAEKVALHELEREKIRAMTEAL